MLIKMQFWLIFKILFSDRDNAFYNLKASQKHAFICASISNKFLFTKINFGSTNIRSIFNCKNAQNPYLNTKTQKTWCWSKWKFGSFLKYVFLTVITRSTIYKRHRNMPSYAVAFPISFYSQKSILVAPTSDPFSTVKTLKILT